MMKEKYTKYFKYLPSKKFIMAMSFITILVAGIYIFIYKSSKENDSETKNSIALKIENQTVNDLIAKDTDADGIVDWEEALWGTNKNIKQTFGDTLDSTYIENRKKELNIESSVNVNKLTETEKFAREFFSSYSAMKATGEVDDDTINNFSSALGQKIVNPALIDRYNEKDIKINNDYDVATKLKYYLDLKELFQSYQSSDIGDELDIVNSGLATGPTTTPNSFSKLPIIGNIYQDLSKKIMDLSVPSELAIYHLKIANSANNTGIAVTNMAEIVADPLVGLEGVSQYQKYSGDLVKAMADLETILLQE